MALRKHLIRSSATRRLLCWIGQLYIRLVYVTSRWTIDRPDIAASLRDTKQPFILAFWHGRLLMMPMAWRGFPTMHMLISGHPDGRVIAETVRHFGIDTVVGSSNEGGSGAVRQMVRFLKAGDCVGITPDGPDGPAMRASRGIIAVARLARVPIVPISYATTRRRILATWDRFLMALPFGRGVFLWGEPIHVPPHLDEAGMEEYRLLVEERLTALTMDADRRTGQVEVTPGTLGRDAMRAARRAAQTAGDRSGQRAGGRG
jgi:lysophospholipid acyltransferase (LPLAT)-like uncharacterized protein